MDILEAIARRRSIRRFNDQAVPRELIEQILHAATLAPSGCNRQPWRFVVVQGAEKDRLVQTFAAQAKGVDADGSAEAFTAHVMNQAPVAILVYNSLAKPGGDHIGIRRISDLSNTQSIGAAIQNMSLAAEACGLGTLWICDILIAATDISAWLGREDELVAAVAVGYSNEAPSARPRLSVQKVTEWR
jgi:nitroreductase